MTRALLTLSKLIKASAEGASEMGGNARLGEYLAAVKPRIDSFYLSLCRVREKKAILEKRESNAVIPSLHILRHLQAYEIDYLVCALTRVAK